MKLKVKSILYIEDCEDIAASVKIILGVLGYHVTIASTGKEGLRILKKEDFDLVIFDIMLPDMSGIEVFEKTVEHHNSLNKHCKYVFLSITTIPEAKKNKMRKMGVADYIPKPFDKKDLIKRISEVLEGS